MRWPWQRRPEVREQSYTEMVSGAAYQAAVAGLATDGLAVVEAAVGVIARAFASARVVGVRDGRLGALLTPELLAWAVRRTLTRGEAVAVLEVTAGRPALRVACGHDVFGGSLDQASWRYRVDLAVPDGTRRRIAPGAAVAHVRYSTDAGAPWRGIGPLGRADLSRTVAAAAERSLQAELNTPHGRIIPIPSGAGAQVLEDGDTLADKFRADITALNGGVMLPETTQTGFGSGRADAPARDWRPEVMQPAPHAGTVQARWDLAIALSAAIGVPAILVLGGPGSDGSGQREAWRRCLHGTIAPLGRTVAAELARVFEEPELALDFADLAASDIAGRARAFGSMVGAGMELTEAARISGVLMEESE